MRRKVVHMTRGGRRVFAQKSRPSMVNLRQSFVPRGGGYL